MRKFRLLFFIIVFCIGLLAKADASSVDHFKSPQVVLLPLKVVSLSPCPLLKVRLQGLVKAKLKAADVIIIPPAKVLDLLGNVPSEPTIQEVKEICAGLNPDMVIWGTLVRLKDSLSIDWRLWRCSTGQIEYASASGSSTSSTFEIQAAQTLLAALFQREKVWRVEVKGNIRMDSDAILAVTSLKPGDYYDPQKIRQDLKAIYKLGYFDDIKADVKKEQKGLVITYIVKEKPVIKRIIYEGNKHIKTKDLEKITELKPDTILNLDKINLALERIDFLYKEKGYYDTKVDFTIKPISKNEVEVIFHIKEGEKVYIKKIEFVGNKAFSDEQLKKLLSISEKGHFSWLKKIKTFFTGGIEPGVYSMGALYRDLGKIISFYHNHGYIDARVGDPEIEQKGKWIYIKIPIEEGPQYRVGKVSIEQDLFTDSSWLLKKLEINKEKFFDRETLRKDILHLTEIFADKGYAYAEVDPIIKKRHKEHIVDIVLKINKGPLVYINRIEISGNTRTRDKVIRRELLIVEQWPFSATRYRKSQDRLRRLGYFDDVNFSMEKGIQKNQMDVHIKVKERPTGTFSIGAGYSSVDKFIFMGQISQRNLFGKGQTLSFNGTFGARTTRYSLSFSDPYFRDTRVSLGLSLYNWSREYEDYTRDSKGGSIRFGYLLTSNLKGYIGYRYDDSNLTDYTYYQSSIIRESADIHITSAIEMGLIRDTRNSFFSPTKGMRTTFSYEHAGGFLGGDSAFEKFVFTDSWYFPLLWHTTGHLRFGLGSILPAAGGKLPVYEKFYLGGLDSVRGYRYGDISPIDPQTGERIGGERMAYVQIENIIPLVKNMGLNGVLFFDMGNVWRAGGPYKLSDIRKSVGFGIRWLSPMGPLRIEWGYNIDAHAGEEKSNWNFRIGGQF